MPRDDVRYSPRMRDRWIRIDLASQRLDLCDGVDVERSYAVSTGAKGAGERLGSEQTPRGAHEIKELIGSSVGEVEAGSALVAQAGTTMDEVVASVRRVSDIVNEISAASGEQSNGIGQVNQAISQMDGVTQQNAALVEQAAAAAESLQQQAATLVALVGEFRMEQAVRAPSRASASLALSERRPS